MALKDVFQDLPEGVVLEGVPAVSVGIHGAWTFITVAEVTRLLVGYGKWAAIKINDLLPHLRYNRTKEDFTMFFLPGIEEAVAEGYLGCHQNGEDLVVWPTPKLAELMQ